MKQFCILFISFYMAISIMTMVTLGIMWHKANKTIQAIDPDARPDWFCWQMWVSIFQMFLLAWTPVTNIKTLLALKTDGAKIIFTDEDGKESKIDVD